MKGFPTGFLMSAVDWTFFQGLPGTGVTLGHQFPVLKLCPFPEIHLPGNTPVVSFPAPHRATSSTLGRMSPCAWPLVHQT